MSNFKVGQKVKFIGKAEGHELLIKSYKKL